MKIAVVTDDGEIISRHFGRARYYEVFEFDGIDLISRETRNKMGHQQFASQDTHEHREGEPHGIHNQDRHMSMFQAISDCDILIVGGMGQGAYDHLKKAGIEPIVTDETETRIAAQRAAIGDLYNHTEALH
jgi:predicted Fe-Mo cluster-binding NifX family protein